MLPLLLLLQHLLLLQQVLWLLLHLLSCLL